jgi:streptogramin lyase
VELSPLAEGVQVAVQPNPATHQVRFMLMGAEGPLRVTVWDAAGRQVAHLQGESWVEWAIPADLSGGLYLYQVEALGKLHTGRLAIQR